MRHKLLLLILVLLPLSMHARKTKRTNLPASAIEMPEPDHMAPRCKENKSLSTPPIAEIEIIRRRLNGTSRQGIDVSHYQGNIDWKKVAKEAEVSYAYIKCSEGATIQDEYYRRNVEEARKAGISVGAYHFYRPASSPADQLANMTGIADSRHMDIVPIIDIESRGKDSNETFIANLRTFIDAVGQHYGCKPMLYTGQNFYNKHLQGLFKDHVWMIAKYQEEAPILEDSHDYAFWQFTSKASVPGIRGNVDRSCLMEGHTLKEIAM